MTITGAALAALALFAGTAGAAEPAAPAPLLAQAAPSREDLRARALMRQFPWITRFWAELRSEERARAERAFRRRGQMEQFDVTWDGMGLQDRVLLLFGPGRGRS
jgi:hypothetical protein